MKILNEKVLIVIILFFSFLIFNNSNCEASQSDLTLNLFFKFWSSIYSVGVVFIIGL